MKFTEQRLPAAPTTSLACVIDFLKARGRLSAEFEATSNEFQIERRTGKVGARRLPSVGWIDRLEDSLYWLLSTATLLYLVLGIIGR